jgi:hypothetical protein
MRRRIAVASLLMLMFSQCSPAGAAADPAVAVAQARQDMVKTLLLEFKCTDVIARGAFSHRDRADPLADATNVFPRAETTRDSLNRLVIDGKQFRYEDNYTYLSRPDGSIQDHNSLIVSDGTTTATFLPPQENINPLPQGFLDSAASVGATNHMILWPITMTFRGADPQFTTYPWTAWTPTTNSLAIEGVECKEYEFKSGNIVIRCWLDPTRDLVPRRISYRKAGVLRYQWDIAFERREPGIWVPVSWVWKEYFPSGNPLRTTRAEVVSIQLNEAQLAEQFALSFPPGTNVIDNLKKKAYIVQANGDMHEVTLAFTEIPNPVTVAAQPGIVWYEKYKLLLAGLAGMLILVALLLLILWKKKQSTT